MRGERVGEGVRCSRVTASGVDTMRGGDQMLEPVSANIDAIMLGSAMQRVGSIWVECQFLH